MEDEFTKEEIETIKNEYFTQHTYNGTDKPVIIDDQTSVYILRGRKRYQEWLNSVHESHVMTDWRTEIRCPGSTPRFYGVRNCKKCEGEQLQHPAGKFMDGSLKTKCNITGEENEQ